MDAFADSTVRRPDMPNTTVPIATSARRRRYETNTACGWPWSTSWPKMIGATMPPIFCVKTDVRAPDRVAPESSTLLVRHVGPLNFFYLSVENGHARSSW